MTGTSFPWHCLNDWSICILSDINDINGVLFESTVVCCNFTVSIESTTDVLIKNILAVF